MSPISLCAVPTCPKPAVRRGRCAEHLREQGRTTRSVGWHLYRTKRWRMLRKRVLFEQPLCAGWPEETECHRIATDVDHIVPLDQGGAPYARANVQALCPTCHGRKTWKERSERARATASAAP